MTKRRAIILLTLILLFIIALLSVAAYTVQTQNDSNATNALTSSMSKVLPVSTVPEQAPSTAVPDAAPQVPNDAVDTDTGSVQYKTVAGGKMGDLYAFEAPIDWNSLHKTIGTCTTETIVSPQNTTIDITPSDCDTTFGQRELVQKDGYNISTSTADSAVFNHVLTTFHIAS